MGGAVSANGFTIERSRLVIAVAAIVSGICGAAVVEGQRCCCVVADGLVSEPATAILADSPPVFVDASVSERTARVVRVVEVDSTVDEAVPLDEWDGGDSSDRFRLSVDDDAESASGSGAVSCGFVADATVGGCVVSDCDCRLLGLRGALLAPACARHPVLEVFAAVSGAIDAAASAIVVEMAPDEAEVLDVDGDGVDDDTFAGAGFAGAEFAGAEPVPVSPTGSAHATPCAEITAAPIPNATASPPLRPI